MLCVDTSLLVSLFVREEHSSSAKRWLAVQDGEILLSPLNELEFINALALRVFRRDLTHSQVFELREKFSELKNRGVFQTGNAPRDVWKTASRIAAEHSAGIGTRSLDVWQVAFALDQKVGVFGTFDRRQRDLAGRVGLQVNPLDRFP